tara:strand:+ start:319 stop:768 length:450 start_codon:yes stop_codon:yes gene_type:complete
MKKLLFLLIIPCVSFGQADCFVTDTVRLVSTWGGIYDDIFGLNFQSLTTKLETTEYLYTDTDGDGKRDYEKPTSIKIDTTLETHIISFDQVGWEKSEISFWKMEELELVDGVFVINYTLKKYGVDCSDDILGRYRYKTGNYLISIEQIK